MGYMDMSTKVIISRAAAAAAGLKRYYTGEPCKHQHLAERYVTTGGCLECVHPTVAKIALDHTSHKTMLRAYNLKVDKRLEPAHLGQLQGYLQQCLDAYVDSQKGLPLWCAFCEGAAYTIHKGEPKPVRPCLECDRTGYQPADYLTRPRGGKAG